MGEEGGDDPFEGWVLDDAFVAAAPVPEASAAERVRRPEPHHPVPPSPPPRRRRSPSSPGRRAVAVAIGALVVVIAAAVARDAMVGSPDLGATDPGDERLLVDGRAVRFPTPAPSADQPLGTPPVVPDAGRYEPTNLQADGSVVAWDPCRPVRYVVGGDPPPAGAEALVEAAIVDVEAATGLTFERDGPTDEPVDEDRSPVQPDRYGDRWAPVLVAWTDPAGVPGLAGPVGGRGGATAVGRPGGLLVYVTGTLLLDGPQLAGLLDEPGGTDRVLGVIRHELAHVVGLAHVDDGTELMHPEGQPGVTTFGPGDRAGLAHLGRGPCVPDL